MASVIDPVCGMQVDEKSAPAQVNYAGKTYYFCSKECAQMFKAAPTKYVEAPVGKQ